jgi:phosphotriesterase-related protein
MTAPDVETVRGRVPIAGLGQTLMHEHIFTLDIEYHQHYPGDWGSDDRRVQEAADRLNQAKASGIDTIVDLTVFGLGRSIERIQRVADRTDMTIVVATGVYTFDDVPRPFRFRGPGTMLGGPEPMTEVFVREIEVGIGNTSVRAGMLKCATGGNGITPGVERVIRAVAEAHRATGVPITTHSVARLKQGLDQQRILRDEGVDLNRVVIGHCGDSQDIDYLVELATNGSFLGMDQFGIEHLSPFDARVKTVVELCRLGLANRLVLSQDFACYADIMDEATRASLNPNWSYLRVIQDVVPALRLAGVSEDEIKLMLVDNPSSILSVGGAAEPS